MNERPHWSYSSISQFLRCPLQFYFKRILRLQEPSVSGDLVLGSSVHSALAEYHLSLQQGRRPKLPVLHKVVTESWENRQRERDIVYKAGQTRDDLIAVSISLLETYLAESPPTGIVSVEQSVTVPIRNSQGNYLETPLVAVADLVTRAADGLKITELKTSGRAYGEAEVAKSLQPTCYVNAALEKYGQRASVEYAVLIKTKTPKLQRLQTTRSEAELGRLGDIVETIERAIVADVFYPVENPLNCSTCPYRRPCREWSPLHQTNGESIELQRPTEMAECSSN